MSDGFRRTATVGLLGTYPPTACGIASFGAALSRGLEINGMNVKVVRIADNSSGTDDRIVGELVNGSPSSAVKTAALLNSTDMVVVQHEYGTYGGPSGADIIDIIDDIRVPVIVVLHTVLSHPSAQQRSVLDLIAAKADRVVVMSKTARSRLHDSYGVDRRKVSMIPHGAMVPSNTHVRRSGRPTLLTWGLLGPGKGIERVIDAMHVLQDLPGRPRYLVAGRTHPKVLAAEGEAYREARRDQARRCGVADAVSFDDEYRSVGSLSAMIRSAAVVVLPYDSTDQVTSGVLVDAIANGRPVVATAFPHAVELLDTGAGIVVPHDDHDALARALRRVLTEPCLAGSMAGHARQLAPAMAWSVVARAYLDLAQTIPTGRESLV
ncbi:glycosyltransferase [Mycobacterium sp. shizuoka-1]|uniref:glycosyltransferase n=1 Tax=Mycobacterium sp. shizuoka-1 TaxID=2039281 RepID=UPI001E4A96F8|nr:glycosyltransferase [Mycobacterium sp. shizuoka-1]